MINKALLKVIEGINTKYDNLTPSQWAEKHRKLTGEVSTQKGRFRYDFTPYTRELIDTFSPYHPAKVIAIMKGAQTGFTEGLIVNGILWMIANEPGNCLFLSATDELSKEIIEMRLDQGIQSCGIQDLIRPNTIRKRNQRTGDTSKSKEFSGGRLFAGGMQSIVKMVNQRSIKYGIFDDWDTVPMIDKKEGNLFDLIQQRFSTAAKSMKQYYISTPRSEPSNIKSVYLKGDQRKWKVPCPKCGAYIELIWHEMKNNQPTGVFFKKDKYGNLMPETVGYICQECGSFFKEKYKYEMNLQGNWEPTAKPQREGYYSYQFSCLASAPNMYNWTHYANNWVDIYRDGIERKSKLKAFKNQVLGETWEERTESIKANKLRNNCRYYDVGIVPNKQSIEDGNGMIVMLTCGADLNGTIDDARLDFDVWAHAENGTVYSIRHGSIGTYQPNLRNDEEREKFSYRNEVSNNVWDILWNDVCLRTYPTDDGQTRKIMLSGIDTGYMTYFAYAFIDQYPHLLVGLKGDDPEKFYNINRDKPSFVPARERPNLFILTSDKIKDELAEMILLKWTEGNPQPAGFINFPRPTSTLYTKKYFDQYEAETKVLEENEDRDAIAFKWKNVHSKPNHAWDCAYYNLAVRDIAVRRILKAVDEKDINWYNYVQLIKKAVS